MDFFCVQQQNPEGSGRTRALYSSPIELLRSSNSETIGMALANLPRVVIRAATSTRCKRLESPPRPSAPSSTCIAVAMPRAPTCMGEHHRKGQVNNKDGQGGRSQTKKKGGLRPSFRARWRLSWNPKTLPNIDSRLPWIRPWSPNRPWFPPDLLSNASSKLFS